MSLRDYVNADNTGFQFPLLEIGNGGYIDYNDFKIRIGQNAGKFGMEGFAVAIGNRAGENNLSGSAIAIGADAGRFDADATSISIGQESGQDGKGLNSISMGLRSAQLDQGIDAVAIGRDAGNGFQSQDAVALGREAGFSSQGTNSVAVGKEAGKTIQGEGCVAIGNLAGEVNQNARGVAIGFEAGRTSQNSGVAIGDRAGQSSQGSNSVAIGRLAGQTSQSSNSIAIGNSSGIDSQSSNSVAIGIQSGQISQGSSAIAIGNSSGRYGANNDSITLGRLAGGGTIDELGNPRNRLGQNGIAIGVGSQSNSNNKPNTIAIGNGAGQGILNDLNAGMGDDAIALGLLAGRYGAQARTVAVGREAGDGAPNVWTTRTTPTPSGAWRSIIGGSPTPLDPATQTRLVAVGFSSTNQVMYSDDAINWNLGTYPESNGWRGASWSQDLQRYIAVSQNGTTRVMYSSDGITWENTLITTASGTDLNNSDWRGSCVGFPSGVARFVAVGQNGRYMWSDNGLDWNTLTRPDTTQLWLDVVWSPELSLYVALAFNGTTRSMYSSDGITWSDVGVSGLEGASWIKLVWAGAPRNRFVAIAETAPSGSPSTRRVAYSDNGINWTMALATESNSWRDIAWSPTLSLFCAVSTSGSNRTMTSPDGITWTPRIASVANGHTALIWSPQLNLFVSVANSGTGDQVMTSNMSLINRLGQDSIAMGYRAGRYAINSADTIAIGREAGEGTVGSATGGQGGQAIAIGLRAGRTSQGVNTVAIGNLAGNTSQNNNAVAVGVSAAQINQGQNSVAIGNVAGQTSQGNNSVAIGNLAGTSNQNNGAVAIGTSAAQINQGENAVAIGRVAGQTSQPANTIILNATGVAVNGSQTDSLYVAPIRQFNPQSELLHYNNTTNEITRSNGNVIWPSPINPSDAFFDMTFNPAMEVTFSDRTYVRIGRYIKGNMTCSWGVASTVVFGALPALLLPSFADVSVGSRIVGEFILTTSGTSTIQYSGKMVVNSANKDRAVLYLNRYNTTVPPPFFTNLQVIGNTTPDGSMQNNGVLEMSFDYISAN